MLKKKQENFCLQQKCKAFKLMYKHVPNREKSLRNRKVSVRKPKTCEWKKTHKQKSLRNFRNHFSRTKYFPWSQSQYSDCGRIYFSLVIIKMLFEKKIAKTTLTCEQKLIGFEVHLKNSATNFWILHFFWVFLWNEAQMFTSVSISITLLRSFFLFEKVNLLF